MRRLIGTAFGIGTQILFAFTVWHLFWFLKGQEPAAGARGSLLLDAGLAVQFAVPHSLLLLPRVRDRLDAPDSRGLLWQRLLRRDLRSPPPYVRPVAALLVNRLAIRGRRS